VEASNLVTTLDWIARKVKKAAMAEAVVYEEVLLRMILLIGADQVVRSLSERQQE
jgi:hypothetical protein